MLSRLKRLWRSADRPASSPRPRPANPRAFISGARIYGAIDRAHLERVSPDLALAVVRSADRALEHRFNLLGSGPYEPVDAQRAWSPEYRPIDWAWDPVAQARFPNTQPSTGCDIAAIRPPGGDIKRPWELARCHHWVTLGQAWLLSRDERYAHELFRQCDDFMEANPVGRGVHWTCTMDVAIRVANWIAGLELVRDAPIDEESWRRALEAALAHGRFIRSHLENHYEVTSNHFLSNVVGLLLTGLAFRDGEEGQAWTDFALAALETEIQVQVLEDGMDFESSLPYHRLVTELFFAGWRAAVVAGRPLSNAYEARLRTMHAFTAAVLRPDGLMPQVGDADDGRLHMFRGHDCQLPQDPRHLFGPAAAAFATPGWSSLAGPEGSWDAMWWGLTAEAVPFAPPDSHAFFPDAGLVAHRDAAGNYLLISNGAVGTKGFGNHKHNDLLSFEYHLRGRALIVDPGSYVYTSDPDARNLLRSVVSHSTIAVAGAEPNDFKAEWLFRMFERASPEHVSHTVSGEGFTYAGRHRGFAASGVGLVTRTFEWTPGRLRIVDQAEVADPGVMLEWRFQLDPRVRVTPPSNGRLQLAVTGAQAVLACPADLEIVVEAACYSPSYGIREESRQIICRDAARRGGTRWEFTLTADPGSC